ncbi:hypothetical protein [Streptomyces hydrogenans]|uniref:hypothetical protein n=1 Tax=Streptomyces hydrogenans TaxID=1873719 RepID=UPI003447A01F
MAKRRIGEPKVPVGPEYDFFVLMQRHVLHQGDKALTVLAAESGWSRQTWHKALRGPALPNRDLVKALVEHLYAQDEGHAVQARMVADALAAWTRAMESRTSRERGQRRGSESGTEQAPRPIHREPALYAASAAGLQGQVITRILREAHERVGRPSVRTIAQRMPEDVRLGRTTIHEVLTGRRVPSLSRTLDLLAALENRPVSAREMDEAMQRAIIEMAGTVNRSV